MFIICFSIVSPDSLENVETKWRPELDHFGENVPKILVGCKEDLRHDSDMIEKLSAQVISNKRIKIILNLVSYLKLIGFVCQGLKPVSSHMGKSAAKRIKAEAYYEVSARNNKDHLREVFEHAARLALKPPRRSQKKKTESAYHRPDSL